MNYELLKHGDIVQDNDEFLQDDCITWEKTAFPFTGNKYNVYFHQPCRRPVTLSAKEEQRQSQIAKGLEIAKKAYEEHRKDCTCPADGHSELCPIHKVNSSPR